MKLHLKKLQIIIKTMGEYLFPIEKVTSYFKSINSKKDLQKFIQQRSAHVTQNTLYGYLKTRMGHKFTIMVDDEVYSQSINLAKWNIYMVALADCTFYTHSYLMNEKGLKENNSKEIYFNIISSEKENGLSVEIFEKANTEFLQRYENIDFKNYYIDKPFHESCLALYNWSPIADELKILDKKIVLNSMKLKWNLIVEEFKNLTKNLSFN
ncbi:esterase [Pelagibacteraceae bacterium]|nr:esterase [Pelagibacteraceae bacterium]MDC0952264.1 esterase [Pelagibacteraceae bacterium]